jgi:hypothetical protein
MPGLHAGGKRRRSRPDLPPLTASRDSRVDAIGLRRRRAPDLSRRQDQPPLVARTYVAVIANPIEILCYDGCDTARAATNQRQVPEMNSGPLIHEDGKADTETIGFRWLRALKSDRRSAPLAE